MKTSIRILLVLMTFATLVGCGEKEQRESIRGGRGRSNRVDSREALSGSEYPGFIIGSPQDLFQDATEGFVSAFMPPRDLGTVSGSSNASTGVRFYAEIDVDEDFDPRYDYDDLRINESNSFLEIAIVDSEASREGYIQAGYELVEYQVSGNRFVAIFENDGDRVEFDGAFDNSYYSGTVYFDNQNNYDGGYGEAWTWGAFYIPVCDFFRCR